MIHTDWTMYIKYIKKYISSTMNTDSTIYIRYISNMIHTGVFIHKKDVSKMTATLDEKSLY